MIDYATAVGLCADSYDRAAVWDAQWSAGNCAPLPLPLMPILPKP